MSRSRVTEADLHAYADGLLSDSRRLEVEEYLAMRPDEAARVHNYRDQNAGLRALFNPVVDEQIPEHLLDAVVTPVGRSLIYRRSLQRFAASVLIAFVGGLAGWFLHGQTPDTQSALPGRATNGPMQSASLARQAAIAHVVYSPDMRRPVEIGADQEEQLVTWLSKRLGTKIRPPKLGALGYELMGGRLLPGNNGPVAQFMYGSADGQRLTLYVSHEDTAGQGAGFRFAQEGQVNVFYWIDDKFGYALSAAIDRAALAKIATAVYDQLESKQ